MKSMESLFSITSSFNESTGYFEFTSKLSLNQKMFSRTMADEGYPVEEFVKQEAKETGTNSTSAIAEPAKKEEATAGKTPGDKP